MVNFKDFVPERIKKGGFLSDAKYQQLEDKVQEANKWVEANGYTIINVETVVLPNIWETHEEGSVDVDISTSGTNASSWHQFIRVWYK
ncbi:MAG: hypothetical protein RJQ09_09245 [Cyclobacteriaceae bacterium]